MVQGHGDDLYSCGQPIVANFSTNVWYEADLQPLTEFLRERLECIAHYPEPDAFSLRKVIAGHHRLQTDRVLAGNGATELFYLVAHAFAGSHTLLIMPSFSEYEDACRLYKHRLEFCTRVQLNSYRGNADLMFLCNPNNPDGQIWRLEEIRDLLIAFPERILVVDESFIHFAPETASVTEWVDRYPNLVVIRSLTKCYAIPGLRLGYLLGNPELVRFVSEFQQPWSVNALAIEAGKFLLEYRQHILPDALALLQRQRSFSERMATLPDFYPVFSHTSFFLTKTEYDSAELKSYLLEKYGILIRDASNFRSLDCHYFRVNTLEEQKNEMLLKALREFTEK